MGLTTCNTCGQTVASDAKACVHCGKRYPGQRLWMFFLIPGITVVFFGMMCAQESQDAVKVNAAQVEGVRQNRERETDKISTVTPNPVYTPPSASEPRPEFPIRKTNALPKEKKKYTIIIE